MVYCHIRKSRTLDMSDLGHIPQYTSDLAVHAQLFRTSYPMFEVRQKSVLDPPRVIFTPHDSITSIYWGY